MRHKCTTMSCARPRIVAFGLLLIDDGHRAEARVAMQRALALKPGDSYYAAQLGRLGGVP